MPLQAGAPAIGADFQNLATKAHQPYDSGTTTSTSYTTTRSGATSPVGVFFTGPPSGLVTVLWNASLSHPTSTVWVACSYQLRTGTTLAAGTVIQSASDNFAIVNYGPNADDKGRSNLCAVTPGTDYNITLQYKVETATTGTINRVELIVVPCIA